MVPDPGSTCWGGDVDVSLLMGAVVSVRIRGAWGRWLVSSLRYAVSGPSEAHKTRFSGGNR
jgi:hypothetical protein